MVSVLGVLPAVVLLAVNTLAAALLTRLFRVRLETNWGAAVFVAFLVPVVLTLTTIAVGAVAGPALGSRGLVVGLFVLLPLALGVTVDVFWMPAPAEVELPERMEQ